MTNTNEIIDVAKEMYTTLHNDLNPKTAEQLSHKLVSFINDADVSIADGVFATVHLVASTLKSIGIDDKLVQAALIGVIIRQFELLPDKLDS